MESKCLYCVELYGVSPIFPVYSVSTENSQLGRATNHLQQLNCLSLTFKSLRVKHIVRNVKQQHDSTTF